MSPVVRRSIVALCLSLAMALALALPTAAPSQAAIPLPHEDPFYAYDGATPLQESRSGHGAQDPRRERRRPGSGQGAVPATQLLYRTQDEQGQSDGDRDHGGQPDRAGQRRPRRLPQLLRRPRRQVLAELHPAGWRPGRGELRAGLRRDRAGAGARGPGLRRDRARLRGHRPALGGGPRVRLEHPRRHPGHRELPRHAAAARRSACSATPAARSAASGPASSRRRTPPSSTSSAPRSAASRSTWRTTPATSTAATPGPA